MREDITESRREVERLRDERAGLQGQLIDTQRELGREKEVRRDGEEERRMEREIWEREQQAANQLIQDLSREVNHRLYLYYHKQTNEEARVKLLVKNNRKLHHLHLYHTFNISSFYFNLKSYSFNTFNF